MILQEAPLCLVQSEHNSGHFTSFGRYHLFMTLVQSLSCVAAEDLFLIHTDNYPQGLLCFHTCCYVFSFSLCATWLPEPGISCANHITLPYIFHFHELLINSGTHEIWGRWVTRQWLVVNANTVEMLKLFPFRLAELHRHPKTNLNVMTVIETYKWSFRHHHRGAVHQILRSSRQGARSVGAALLLENVSSLLIGFRACHTQRKLILTKDGGEQRRHTRSPRTVESFDRRGVRDVWCVSLQQCLWRTITQQGSGQSWEKKHCPSVT